MKFAVLVLERDGVPRYLRHGDDPDAGPIVVFTSRQRAEETAAFWRDGLGDDVQSVNVVQINNRLGSMAQKRRQGTDR